jgi:hypothetical protein
VANRTLVACSWCNALNILTGEPVWCPCGHRADLPRLYCTCAGCTGPGPTPTEGDFAELTAWLDARRNPKRS